MSRRSSDYLGLKSPRGSKFEDQLRLDLIDEEEKFDEMLKETHNYW